MKIAASLHLLSARLWNWSRGRATWLELMLIQLRDSTGLAPVSPSHWWRSLPIRGEQRPGDDMELPVF